MDIKRLTVGLVIKNYKELCQTLKLPVKAGKGKLMQLKELERYFKFEKEGVKYRIIEIYKIPKEKEKRNGNNCLYQHHIQLLLLNYLASEVSDDNFNIVDLSTNEILRITKMCNENYITKEKFEYLIKNHNVTKFDINDFYRNTSMKFSKIINSALSNLQARCILNVKNKYKIVEDYQSKYGMQNNVRTATEEEEVLIMNFKKEVLNEMNLKTELEVRLKFKQKDFYEKVNNKLQKHYNWLSCYRVKQISFHQSELLADIKRHIQDYKIIKQEQEQLNGKVVDFFNTDAKNRYEKNLKELTELNLKMVESVQNNDYETARTLQFELNKMFKLNNDFVESQIKINKYMLEI